MNYQEKYLKYKIKYFNLKKQIGNGKLEGCLPNIRSAIPGRIYEEFNFHMTSYTDDYLLKQPDILPDTDPLYDLFLETLEKINKSEKSNKILILKLGSSSTADKGDYILQPSIQSLKKNIENDIQEDSSNIFVIYFDPINPQYFVLNDIVNNYKIPKENLFSFKGFFPIAPGCEKANIIINKLINLEVSQLIIINEIGEGCYNSIRAIINLRKNVLYYAYLVNTEYAFDCGLQIYSHKGTYNRCKRENSHFIKYNWVNLKTLTDEGDNTEPLTYDEKLAKEAESEKIIINVTDISNNKVQLTVNKNILVKDFAELLYNKSGMTLNRFSILGRPYDFFENKNNKLFELNNLLIKNPQIFVYSNTF